MLSVMSLPSPSSLPGLSSQIGAHPSHQPRRSADSPDIASHQASCQPQASAKQREIGPSEPSPSPVALAATTEPSSTRETAPATPTPGLRSTSSSSPLLDSAHPSVSAHPGYASFERHPYQNAPSPLSLAPEDPVVAALLMDKNDRPARHARGSSFDTFHDRLQAQLDATVKEQTHSAQVNSLQQAHQHQHQQQQQQQQQPQEQQQRDQDQDQDQAQLQLQLRSPRPVSCPSPPTRYRPQSLGSLDIEAANMDLRPADLARPVMQANNYPPSSNRDSSSFSPSFPPSSPPASPAPGSAGPRGVPINGINPGATSNVHSATSQSPKPRKRFYASQDPPSSVDMTQPSSSSPSSSPSSYTTAPTTPSNIPAPIQRPAQDDVFVSDKPTTTTTTDKPQPERPPQQTKSRRSRLRRALSFSPHSSSDLAASLVDHPHHHHQEQSTADGGSGSRGDGRDADSSNGNGNGGSAIGEDIYSSRQLGRGDQNSISSTASSASFVLRKMGNSVRTKSRSIAGLFRTKSGLARSSSSSGGSGKKVAEDRNGFIVEQRSSSSSPMPATASTTGGSGGSFVDHIMAKAAERARLGHPSFDGQANMTLGRGSVLESLRDVPDAESPTGNANGRGGVTGDEEERADALAEVGTQPRQPTPSPTAQISARKGILKHTQDFPKTTTTTTTTSSQSHYNLTPPPLSISVGHPTPPSSEPSTPNGSSKHDHDVPAQSMSGQQPVPSPPADSPTPNLMATTGTGATTTTPPPVQQQQQRPPSQPKRLNWNNKIQLFDTWCSNEYDRRGDSSTTAHLTPVLAARIREELNTFKMEMEVHESSKGFTHFF